MEALAQERNRLWRDIRGALAAGQIVPYYQPIVDLETGALVEFEALARWLHPELGIVPPSRFIPIAEEAALIREVTEAILGSACRSALNWPRHIGLAVNLSPLLLKDSSIVSRILAVVAAAGLVPAHDVIVDPDGMVWFSHFGEQFLSKMDPKTGKTTDYPIPVQKPDHPKGTLDLEVDQDGHIWVGLMYQTGLARFDRKSETFRMYPIPKEWQRDATQQSHFSVAASKVDGKAWVKNSDGSQIMRLDIATGEYENLGTFRNPKTDRPIGIYGIYADQQNNCYILEFQAGGIGKIDAKTGKLSFYPTPTPYARARRGRVDAQNRLWFAEFGGNAIGMFDPETEKITEYRNPLQWEAPYDVVADRNGEAWEVNETSDRVGRLDPRTAEITNYLLPRNGNIRRVFVDDRSNPVTVWIGNNLAASIVKIEPLD